MKYENTRRKKNTIEEEKEKNDAKKLILEQLMLLSVDPTSFSKNENQNLKIFGF